MPTNRPGGAAHCRNMDEVRQQIDRLDRDIVRLLAERQGYVGQAAHLKPNRAEVVVPWRIEEIVVKVRGYAAQHDADPDLIEAVYRHLIDRYIAFEQAAWDDRAGAGNGGGRT